MNGNGNMQLVNNAENQGRRGRSGLRQKRASVPFVYVSGKEGVQALQANKIPQCGKESAFCAVLGLLRLRRDNETLSERAQSNTTTPLFTHVLAHWDPEAVR